MENASICGKRVEWIMSEYKKMVLAMLYLIHMENVQMIEMFTSGKAKDKFSKPLKQIGENILANMNIPKEWFEVKEQDDDASI